ncbi:hypothetical protein CQA53_04475 [Helicobacter didelphidarum]|uniref:Uncharacterized protein n=1 Tax=Helicobacter didelphidarum TaxID=2040648 RepID=A0A3D8IM84_9HELI|nr:hypothetical protein [Helicobacter didelphidarum]RDU66065.1 hypothetical protein CQA53_04475 [Helicobacter didelphidarum]
MLSFLHSVWAWVSKIIKMVIAFQNIVDFFRNPERLKQLQRDKNLIAVSIKEKQSNGEYNILNCLFNEKTEKIVGEENSSNRNAQGVETRRMDAETERSFGNKDMIVLE